MQAHSAVFNPRDSERNEIKSEVERFLASGGEIKSEDIRVYFDTNTKNKLSSLQQETLRTITQMRQQGLKVNPESLAVRVQISRTASKARIRSLAEKKAIVADKHSNVNKIL